MKSVFYITKFSLVLLSVLLLTQCEKEPVTIPPVQPPTTTTNPTIVESTGEENYLNLDSDYIFDQTKLHTFELTVPNLAAIDSDPTAEQYVQGSLSFEDETIGPVGVRYKGSFGSFAGCTSSGAFSFEPSGFKTCTKLSMKVKINWEGREDKFYGLRKLQFHSMNQDPTQMRDRLGYWLFDQMGIPSPRAVHVRLKINGKFVGLFILVEQIDGRFSKYHLDDGDGNVYKEVWPLNDQGNPHFDAVYRDALKTNEDDNPSFDIIKGLAIDLDQAANDEEIKAAIIKWMDLDKIMAYAMVDRTIKHDDGPFHWYCFNGCSPHNFYFIEEPSREKIHLIPWDLDNAFQNITSPNGVTSIQDDWGETSNNCMPSGGGIFGLQQLSAACDRLVYGMTLFEEEFRTFKIQFDNGPFSEESIDALLDVWSQQVRESTQEAANLHEDALSMNFWQNQMNELKLQCNIARD